MEKDLKPQAIRKTANLKKFVSFKVGGLTAHPNT